MNKPSEAINIVNLDHLGIVAGIIDEMELVEEVNKKVGIIPIHYEGTRSCRLKVEEMQYGQQI